MSKHGGHSTRQNGTFLSYRSRDTAQYRCRSFRYRVEEYTESPGVSQADTPGSAAYVRVLIAQVSAVSTLPVSGLQYRCRFSALQMHREQWSRRCRYHRNESPMVQGRGDTHR